MDVVEIVASAEIFSDGFESQGLGAWDAVVSP
jgi:hypothetical protein